MMSFGFWVVPNPPEVEVKKFHSEQDVHAVRKSHEVMLSPLRSTSVRYRATKSNSGAIKWSTTETTKPPGVKLFRGQFVNHPLLVE
jgi:hypothetical protein